MALNILLGIIAVLLFILAAIGFGIAFVKPGAAGRIAEKAKGHIDDVKVAFANEKKTAEEHNQIKFARRMSQAEFERQAEEKKMQMMERGEG